MQLSRTTIALVAVALLYPIAICAIFYPTPFSDLREQINWGLNFPFYTWKHPPMQSWVAGLVALTGARDAWGYTIVGQAINLLGLYYLIRAAHEFIAPDAALKAVILVAGSIFFIAAVPTFLLNADQLLFPLWAGVLYYALAALLRDRWRDWLLLGVFAGLALLTKYFTLLLIASLLVSALWHADFRKHFLSPKLYVSGVVCATIAATNAIPMLLHPELLRYPLSFMRRAASIFDRSFSLLTLAWSLVLYLLPAGIVLAVLAYRREGVTVVEPQSPGPRFITTAAVVFVILTAAVVVGTGIPYSQRYSHPIFAVSVLAVLSTVSIPIEARERCAHVALVLWGFVILGSVGYAFTFVNASLIEPAPAAAEILRARWAKHYSCGPAYITGENRPAYAVALYYGKVIGLSRNDFDFVQWIDRDLLQRHGAIVIGTTQSAADMVFAGEFPNRTPTETITLPYRRSWSSQRHSYNYYFVPPRNCAR